PHAGNGLWARGGPSGNFCGANPWRVTPGRCRIAPAGKWHPRVVFAGTPMSTHSFPPPTRPRGARWFPVRAAGGLLLLAVTGAAGLLPARDDPPPDPVQVKAEAELQRLRTRMRDPLGDRSAVRRE